MFIYLFLYQLFGLDFFFSSTNLSSYFDTTVFFIKFYAVSVCSLMFQLHLNFDNVLQLKATFSVWGLVYTSSECSTMSSIPYWGLCSNYLIN